MTESAPPNPVTRRLYYWGLFLILLTGIFLRTTNFETLKGTGFDEGLYSRYIEKVDKYGVFHLPEIFEIYIEDQQASPIAFLPPSRITFFVAAATWHQIFHTSFLESVRAVSASASVLFLLTATAFAWRQQGPKTAIAMATLIAMAPTQIYIAHRALIDGFFAFIALLVIWFLWEVLQNPRSRKWLVAYGIALALMVLTKENAAFVYLAVLGLLAANRFCKLGAVTNEILIVTVLGPTLGFGLLVACAGGIETLYTALSLNVQKSYVLPYAIATGDGPWFRYLSDLILISPVLMLFAIAGLFQIKWQEKSALFLLGFILFSYLIMGNLRYGMNLRYALIWDYALRFLALIPIYHWTNRIENERRRTWIFGLLIGVLALSELGSYHRLFIVHQVYDLIPLELLKALRFLK